MAFAYFRDPNCHGGNISYWEQYDPQDAKVFQFENQGAEVSGLRPDEVRLDSYVSGTVESAVSCADVRRRKHTEKLWNEQGCLSYLE